MTRDTKEDSLQQTEQQGTAARTDLQRRRLLRAGVSSSLLLTVASRPAWANGGMCTASALASANASGRHNFEGCSISAGWWKTSKQRWPIPHTTAFHDIFPAPVTYKGKVLYFGHSLGDVIDLNGGRDPAPGNLGFHLVGAYLNAYTFPPNNGLPGYGFTTQQIVDAFNALLGMDTSTEDSSSSSRRGGPGSDSSPADSAMQSLAATLEYANNQFDSSTDKPDW